jgi:arabinogalactan oligomer / maltooligosaccharide transport system permease protein
LHFILSEKGKEERVSKRSVKKTILNIFFVIFTVSVLVPLIYTVVISFSDIGSLYGEGIGGASFTLRNYDKLFKETEFGLWMLNTFIVSVITAFFSVAITLISAHTFSRADFKGRKWLMIVFLILQMFPGPLSMIAIFKILQILGLINTISGLIFVYVGITLPATIWIMKGYFDSTSVSIEESAVIDGASWLQLMFKIVFPIAKPMISVIIVYNFIICYNEFVLSSIILTGSRYYTVARGLRTFAEEGFGANWPVFAAGAVLSSVPILFFFYMIQDFFISGFTSAFSSSVKE